MIPRLQQTSIERALEKFNKVILLLGARQVGKTILVRNIEKKYQNLGKKVLYINCDIEEQLNAINTKSEAILRSLLKNIELLIIDEAQTLENPGITIKIIYTLFPTLKVLVTGSSAFDLKNKMSDALTGRYIDFSLFPLSLSEIISIDSSSNPVLIKNQANELLSQIMLYGLYPEVYTEGNPTSKGIFLEKIKESYLFKDILAFQRIRKSQMVYDLARAIAYQVGSEVNENELGNKLKIDRKTVSSYLDILEKSYVIVRVYPYFKNPRREIGKNYKIYFIDLGIRNALIGDFNPISLRADTGALWENFLIIERMKKLANSQKTVVSNFWRSYTGAEIDYIEKPLNSPLEAFEFKYTENKLSKGAYSFSNEYRTKVNLINIENYLDFII